MLFKKMYEVVLIKTKVSVKVSFALAWIPSSLMTFDCDSNRLNTSLAHKRHPLLPSECLLFWLPEWAGTSSSPPLHLLLARQALAQGPLPTKRSFWRSSHSTNLFINFNTSYSLHLSCNPSLHCSELLPDVNGAPTLVQQKEPWAWTQKTRVLIPQASDLWQAPLSAPTFGLLTHTIPQINTEHRWIEDHLNHPSVLSKYYAFDCCIDF